MRYFLSKKVLPAVVKPEVPANRKRLLLDLGLLCDLGLIRACRFARCALVFQLAVRTGVARNAVVFPFAVWTRVARRAVALHLAVRAGGARHAAVFPLAVRAPFALCALVFQFAMRGGVALRALVFHLAVRAGVAVRAVAFQLTVRAADALHAAVLHLAVRARVAPHTPAFLLSMRAPFPSHRVSLRRYRGDSTSGACGYRIVATIHYACVGSLGRDRRSRHESARARRVVRSVPVATAIASLLDASCPLFPAQRIKTRMPTGRSLRQKKTRPHVDRIPRRRPPCHAHVPLRHVRCSPRRS